MPSTAQTLRTATASWIRGRGIDVVTQSSIGEDVDTVRQYCRSLWTWNSVGQCVMHEGKNVREKYINQLNVE